MDYLELEKLCWRKHLQMNVEFLLSIAVEVISLNFMLEMERERFDSFLKTLEDIKSVLSLLMKLLVLGTKDMQMD